MQPNQSSEQQKTDWQGPSAEQSQPAVQASPEIQSASLPPTLSLPVSPATTTNPLASTSLATNLPHSDPANLKKKTLASSDAPPAAEDLELIEKDWVFKVKQTLSKTKGDPYKQSKAISELRADYLKKRYNKDLKLSDG